MGAIVVIASLGSPVAADGPPLHPPGQVIRDITYCRDSGVPQTLDLLYPTIAVAYPRPVVLWVHGGTWVSGNNQDAYTNAFVKALRAAGFIVATMNYELAPAHPFPAQALDLTCGVRSLREKAAIYDIDSAHIGALGGSAGGHLVQMLGVDDGSAEFVDHRFHNYSSNVQAVASLWGISNLTRGDLGPGDMHKLPSIFGDPSTWALASPIHYVREGLPPFLFVHGKEDTDVPPYQSKSMYLALLAKAVPATLIMVQHAGHRLKPSGGVISPSFGSVVRSVVSFFRATLAG